MKKIEPKRHVIIKVKKTPLSLPYLIPNVFTSSIFAIYLVISKISFVKDFNLVEKISFFFQKMRYNTDFPKLLRKTSSIDMYIWHRVM